MSDGWTGVETFGRLQTAGVLTDTSRARRPPPTSSVWQAYEPVSVASGTAAVAETTVSLPSNAVAPQGTAAVLYRLTVGVTGGGKAKLEVRHRAAGAAVGAVEASNAMGAAATSQVWADWNRGRCTYVVTFTLSPTGVTWDISVVGFLRAA
jgi:hypothetical protein